MYTGWWWWLSVTIRRVTLVWHVHRMKVTIKLMLSCWPMGVYTVKHYSWCVCEGVSEWVWCEGVNWVKKTTLPFCVGFQSREGINNEQNADWRKVCCLWWSDLEAALSCLQPSGRVEVRPSALSFQCSQASNSDMNDAGACDGFTASMSTQHIP